MDGAERACADCWGTPCLNERRSGTGPDNHGAPERFVCEWSAVGIPARGRAKRTATE